MWWWWVTFLLALSTITTLGTRETPKEVTTDDKKTTHEFAETVLRCKIFLEGNTGVYESWQDELAATLCYTGYAAWQEMYSYTGRLPPGYKEALLIYYNNNQTMVDIDICLLDHRRCPEGTLKLADSFSFHKFNFGKLAI